MAEFHETTIMHCQNFTKAPSVSVAGPVNRRKECIWRFVCKTTATQSQNGERAIVHDEEVSSVLDQYPSLAAALPHPS